MREVDPMALLTASQAAMYAGHIDDQGKPKVNVIVNWRNRGLLPVATDGEGREIRDGRGRPYYRLADVARADALTTRRGEAMALSLLARRAPAVALPRVVQAPLVAAGITRAVALAGIGRASARAVEGIG
jgi:hypothetical protein